MLSFQRVINSLKLFLTNSFGAFKTHHLRIIGVFLLLFVFLIWNLRHDIKAGWLGWRLWQQRPSITKTVVELAATVQNPEVSAGVITHQLSSLQMNLDQASNAQAELEKSILLSKLLKPAQTKKLLEQGQAALTLAQQLSQGEHRIVVVLQNSHELRATGGFMGSFADLKLKNGGLQDLSIHDIYEPAGQFTDFVEAPPGLAEYLSSGKGLALPDANWHPDFPSSATDILHFLALGGWQDVEILVAVNSSVIEAVLATTGPIYIPDYGITITADNLATVARADRVQFFPGSKAKSNLLNSLVTQLKLKLSALTPSELLALARTLNTQLTRAGILAYSPNDVLNEPLTVLGVTGELAAISEDQWLVYPVESNVGINKANVGVKREWLLELGEYRSQLTTSFTNLNQSSPLEPETLDYINYYRLILPPAFNLKSVTHNQQPQPTWTTRPLTTLAGITYQEFGWLVEVPQQTTTTVVVELTHPRLTPDTTLIWPIQPGLEPSPLLIRYENQQLQTVTDQPVRIRFAPFRLE